MQDTPAENAVETELTEDGAEQHEGASTQQPITANLRNTCGTWPSDRCLDAPFLVKIVLPHDTPPLELPVC